MTKVFNATDHPETVKSTRQYSHPSKPDLHSRIEMACAMVHICQWIIPISKQWIRTCNGTLKKFKFSQTQLMVNGHNSGKKSDDDVDNSSSYTADANDSMNNKMSELSIKDRIPPPTSTSGDKSHPQITTQLSPPMTFSRNESDPQIVLKPTTPDPMSSSSSP